VPEFQRHYSHPSCSVTFAASFTDAHRDKLGLLEQAHGGTIFLDEVGEMSLQMQALLLRFLENGEIQRRSTPCNSKREGGYRYESLARGPRRRA